MSSLPFTLDERDFLTADELAELDRLRHDARYYGANMSQRSLDRLNWLEVADQRDRLWRALAAEREAGAAEVRARVEAVLTDPEFHIETALGGSDYVREAIRAALSTEEPS